MEATTHQKIIDFDVRCILADKGTLYAGTQHGKVIAMQLDGQDKAVTEIRKTNSYPEPVTAMAMVPMGLWEQLAGNNGRELSGVTKMTTRKQRMGARLGLAGGLIALASWGTAVGVSDYAENRTMTEDARYVMDIDGDHAAQEDPAVKARYDSLKALPGVQATISEYKQKRMSHLRL